MDAPAPSPLWDPAAHEPLVEYAWDPDAARAGIDAIIAGTLAADESGRFWPRHPDDDYGLVGDRDRSLWVGAAGVLWALAQLDARPLELPGAADVYDSWRAAPDVPGSLGLMWGETGVLLVSWRLAPTTRKAARLAELVAATADSPSCELFSGAPGTMLAALHLHEAGESGFAELWRASADRLWEAMRVDPDYGCRLWVQYRRGKLIRSLGAGHGFATNVRVLLRGRALLSEQVVRELEAAAVETAAQLAMREGAFVNWPTSADPYWAELQPARVQWCHGAPGVITSLATVASDPVTDALLVAAGELVWRAGPLRKGAGLCHGTAGNGCALLALWQRSGDPRWLERARRFAMHALSQQRASPSRHALWTGGVGVALYLQACLDGTWRGMPIIDVL